MTWISSAPFHINNACEALPAKRVIYVHFLCMSIMDPALVTLKSLVIAEATLFLKHYVNLFLNCWFTVTRPPAGPPPIFLLIS